MKIPSDAIVTEQKISDYLLTLRAEDDKSGFLALGGYSRERWRELESDLRKLIASEEAVLNRNTPYGDIYYVHGRLVGPNGAALNVITVWIQLAKTGETRFVTLFPDKAKTI